VSLAAYHGKDGARLGYVPRFDGLAGVNKDFPFLTRGESASDVCHVLEIIGSGRSWTLLDASGFSIIP